MLGASVLAGRDKYHHDRSPIPTYGQPGPHPVEAPLQHGALRRRAQLRHQQPRRPPIGQRHASFGSLALQPPAVRVGDLLPSDAGLARSPGSSAVEKAVNRRVSNPRRRQSNWQPSDFTLEGLHRHSGGSSLPSGYLSAYRDHLRSLLSQDPTKLDPSYRSEVGDLTEVMFEFKSQI